MGYFSELDIELQDEWQAEQQRDEREEEEEMQAFVDSGSVVVPADIGWSELDDPFNELGAEDDFHAELGTEELAHIEAQAETQENIHNGYGWGE